jgi:hypothetical protein
MLFHRALGRDLHKLVIAVVDNRRPMLLVMRAMLAAIGAGRIHLPEPDRSYRHDADGDSRPRHRRGCDAASERSGAGQEHEAPKLGRARSRPGHHHNRARETRTCRSGAHQVLALPTSAITLARRLDWLLNDDRPFELKGDHYVVSGEAPSGEFPAAGAKSAEVTLPPPRSACEDEEPLLLDLVETARVARN